jgi:hypothetical protein
MVFVGVFLIILAVIFFFVARSNAGKLHAMNAAETYTAHMLSEVHRKITTALDADALAQPCELTGVIECDAPLQGPYSGNDCVAYRASKVREYEQRERSRKPDGTSETTVERKSDTVESNERRVPFYVRDETGRVLVMPEHADIDLQESANRFAAVSEAWTGDTRTQGWREIEQSLQPGTRVYVLGCAVDHEGKPAMARHPHDSKQRFMISRKSERELAGSAATWSRNMYYAAGGVGGLGLILLIWGLL